MSRKARFPRNRKKAKVRVQRLHARIRNGRRDVLHKTTISKNHAMVCIEALEDLKVKKACPSQRLAQPNNRGMRSEDPDFFLASPKQGMRGVSRVRCGPVAVLRSAPVMLIL